MPSSSSKKIPAAVAALAAVLAAPLPAAADSFASSAISNSFSAALGSVSTSFNASSDASSPGRPLRQGAYRVQEIVAVAGREGYLRLTLRAQRAGAAAEAAAAGEELHHLYLPQETVARAAIAEGQTIAARERSYGFELSKLAADGRTREPFFLIVADERYRELHTRAVTL